MASDRQHPEQDPVEGAPDIVDKELGGSQASRSHGGHASARSTGAPVGPTSGGQNHTQDPAEGAPDIIDKELDRASRTDQAGQKK